MTNLEIIANEIQTTREKYGYFNSTHEVYGVLIEEVEEFFEVVKTGNYKNDDQEKWVKVDRMKSELTQIAAIALRAIDELEHSKINWI